MPTDRIGLLWCPSSRRAACLLTALLALALVGAGAREVEAQVNALGGRVTADANATFNAWTDVPGLSWYVAASASYAFSCRLAYNTSDIGGSLRVSVNGPAGFSNLRYNVTVAKTATVVDSTDQTAYDIATPAITCSVGFPGCSLGATALPAFIRGTFENGATAGTFAIRHFGNNSSVTYTVLRGSFCTVFRN